MSIAERIEATLQAIGADDPEATAKALLGLRDLTAPAVRVIERLASRDLSNGDPQAAYAKFGALAALLPDEVWVLRGLVTAASSAGRGDEAARLLLRLAERGVSHERFWAFERAMEMRFFAEADEIAAGLVAQAGGEAEGWGFLVRALRLNRAGYLSTAVALCAQVHAEGALGDTARRIAARMLRQIGNLRAAADIMAGLTRQTGAHDDLRVACELAMLLHQPEAVLALAGEVSERWPERAAFCARLADEARMLQASMRDAVAAEGPPDPNDWHRITIGLRDGAAGAMAIIWARMSLMARLATVRVPGDAEIQALCGVGYLNWENPDISPSVMFGLRASGATGPLFAGRELIFMLDRRYYGESLDRLLALDEAGVNDDVRFGAMRLLLLAHEGLLPSWVDGGQLAALKERVQQWLPAASPGLRAFLLPITGRLGWVARQWPADATAIGREAHQVGLRRNLAQLGGFYSRQGWQRPGDGKPGEPRVAVVVSGQLRGFLQAWPRLTEHLIRPLGADVVLSAWNRTSNSRGRHAGRLERTLPPAVWKRLPPEHQHTDVFERQYPQTAALLFNDVEFTLDEVVACAGVAGPRLRAVELEDDRDYDRAFALFGHPFDKNQLKMFYRMARGNEALTRIEAEQGRSYTHVIWTRPDFSLLGQLPALRGLLDQRDIAWSAWGTARVFGDHLFLVPREAFRAIGRIFQTLSAAGDNNIFAWRPSRYNRPGDQSDNTFLMGPETLHDCLVSAGYLTDVFPFAVPYRLLGYLSDADRITATFEAEAAAAG